MNELESQTNNGDLQPEENHLNPIEARLKAVEARLKAVEDYPSEEEDYTQKEREAWTDVIIKSWTDDEYIRKLRSDPLEKLKDNKEISDSVGKYFPLHSKPPVKWRGLSSSELKRKLNAKRKRFGQMMISGGWTDANDGEAWVDIIVRAWTDEKFLKKLRDNPKEALKDNPSISASMGEYFPISKERHPELKNLSVQELKEKLDDDDNEYFGWMMMCCR
jgi:ribosomal protein L29